MGPKSQQDEADKLESTGADIAVGSVNASEGALLASSSDASPNAIVENSQASVGSGQVWAARPVERASKERLDLDAVKIFIVLGLLTALMAFIMKSLF